MITPADLAKAKVNAVTVARVPEKNHTPDRSSHDGRSIHGECDRACYSREALSAIVIAAGPLDCRVPFGRFGSIGDNRMGGWISYRSSKAALNQIVRTASIELARTHPHSSVIAVHPGTVATELSDPIRETIRSSKPAKQR